MTLQLVQNSPLVERCRIEFSRFNNAQASGWVLVELAIDKAQYSQEKECPYP